MKKFIVFFLAIIMCFVGSAHAASPTDLEEELVVIEDDDWGEITITFDRKAFLTISKEPQFFGDEMILVVTLIDFHPTDRYQIYWQNSVDGTHWTSLSNEHQRTLTIIIDRINYAYWWRALVEVENL